MSYGICHLNCVPVRKENRDTSEMVTQLLFGDHFEILETHKNWVRIRIIFDFYEGWIDEKQYCPLPEKAYRNYRKQDDAYFTDLVTYVSNNNQHLMPLTLGANLKATSFLGLHYDGEKMGGNIEKGQLLPLALNYLNAPYLWGGKSIFGIDCSGLTQMVYKMAGHRLLRDASQQARQGEALSFIEETEPGDLAFFDNEEGKITHVGLIMKHNFILHAHGKVRIDRLDQTGIFNSDTQSHSHHLRVLKKIL